MRLKTQSLPTPLLHIIRDKGTECPFSGAYTDLIESGTYLCRQCGRALYASTTKFHSGCGWPSFDLEIPRAIKRQADADYKRTEILCAHCGGHLGHVFEGEGLTPKNTRHCVNSLSLDFVSNLSIKDTEEAIFAAGCFWGVEHYLKNLPGVIKTEVGYTGGKLENPSYEAVCKATSGHYEAIRVLYDPTQLNYQALAQYFFEIHDPTQTDGQGPDRAPQYKSAIFYYDEDEKAIALDLIAQLKSKGLNIATQVLPVTPFWRAESYHQNYYEKNGKNPYCHHYVKRF